jgi:pimeloyl-ACP methyl ester carboxylesterase
MTRETAPPLPIAAGSAPVDGVTLHFEQAGSGPPLVLVHGLMGSLSDWRDRLLPLLARNFAVLTYDLRGHGSSDMPPSGYTTLQMSEDLCQLMEHCAIAQADIVGHSFGGAVALYLAVHHPERVRCLTISDTRIRLLQPAQRFKDWTYWPMWKAQLAQTGITLNEDDEMDFALLDSLIPKPVADRNPRRQERWKTLLSSTSAMSDLRDLSGLSVESIQQLTTPAQAIYGELSPCLPTLEKLRELLPSLHATVLPGLGHFFPMTKPALFAEHVVAFHKTVAQPMAAPPPPESEDLA